MRRRRSLIALLVSVALHGVVLASLLWLVSRTPHHPSFGRIPVRIVAGESTSRSPAPVGTAGAAKVGTAHTPHRPAPTSPSATPSPDAATPRASEAPAPSWREPGTVAQWWSGRSVVDYLAACRRGEAPQDSILEPPKAPEQIALARTTDQLNEFALRMRGVWTLEKFQQRLRESFPLMQ